MESVDKKREERIANLAAELAQAEGEEGTPDLNGHPFLLAQVYAMERRDFKMAYLRQSRSGRIRRKMKDHQGAEGFFNDAQKSREGILAVEASLDEEPAEVRQHYERLLQSWERDIDAAAKANLNGKMKSVEEG